MDSLLGGAIMRPIVRIDVARATCNTPLTGLAVQCLLLEARTIAATSAGHWALFPTAPR